jgi:predicted amidohydrolase
MIVNPWGEVIAELAHQEPGVLVAELDLDLVAMARARIPAWRGMTADITTGLNRVRTDSGS